MPKLLSGAEIVFKSLEDQKVEFIFGYPGGAVLPIYDELKNHKSEALHHRGNQKYIQLFGLPML